MKKIKPLRKKHRFIQWLKKFFGIKQPSKLLRELGEIDEMHTYPAFPRQILRQFVVATDIVTVDNTQFPRPTETQIKRALAEKLAHEIVEKELCTFQTSEDLLEFRTHYRAVITVFAPEKEDAQ